MGKNKIDEEEKLIESERKKQKKQEEIWYNIYSTVKPAANYGNGKYKIFSLGNKVKILTNKRMEDTVEHQLTVKKKESDNKSNLVNKLQLDERTKYALETGIIKKNKDSEEASTIDKKTETITLRNISGSKNYSIIAVSQPENFKLYELEINLGATPELEVKIGHRLLYDYLEGIKPYAYKGSVIPEHEINVRRYKIGNWKEIRNALSAFTRDYYFLGWTKCMGKAIQEIFNENKESINGILGLDITYEKKEENLEEERKSFFDIFRKRSVYSEELPEKREAVLIVKGTYESGTPEEGIKDLFKLSVLPSENGKEMTLQDYLFGNRGDDSKVVAPIKDARGFTKGVINYVKKVVDHIILINCIKDATEHTGIEGHINQNKEYKN